MDPELGGQLLSDSVLAPIGMVTGDAADEEPMLAGNARATGTLTAGSTPQNQPEALSVLGDDSFGLDDDQGLIPA